MQARGLTVAGVLLDLDGPRHDAEVLKDGRGIVLKGRDPGRSICSSIWADKGHCSQATRHGGCKPKAVDKSRAWQAAQGRQLTSTYMAPVGTVQ